MISHDGANGSESMTTRVSSSSQMAPSGAKSLSMIAALSAIKMFDY